MTARIMWSIRSRVSIKGLGRKCQLASKKPTILHSCHGDRWRTACSRMCDTLDWLRFRKFAQIAQSHALAHTHIHKYPRQTLNEKVKCAPAAAKVATDVVVQSPLCYALVFVCVVFNKLIETIAGLCVCSCVGWSAQCKHVRCTLRRPPHQTGQFGIRHHLICTHTHTPPFSTSVCRRRRRRQRRIIL